MRVGSEGCIAVYVMHLCVCARTCAHAMFRVFFTVGLRGSGSGQIGSDRLQELQPSRLADGGQIRVALEAPHWAGLARVGARSSRLVEFASRSICLGHIGSGASDWVSGSSSAGLLHIGSGGVRLGHIGFRNPPFWARLLHVAFIRSLFS